MTSCFRSFIIFLFCQKEKKPRKTGTSSRSADVKDTEKSVRVTTASYREEFTKRAKKLLLLLLLGSNNVQLKGKISPLEENPYCSLCVIVYEKQFN